MPFAASTIGAAALTGAVSAGAGALVSGALSPGTSGGSGGGGSYYTPTGLQSADTQWQQLLQQQIDAQAAQNAAGSAYGGQYQHGANEAGQDYLSAIHALQGQAQGAFNTQQDILNAGQGVYNLGMDPRQALYNRTLQQVQDQSGITNSMYGLGSSAAGAGVANQATSNFNIDWQNQQLQRAAQGLSAYTGAAGTAQNLGQYGLNALGQAPQYALAAGQVPYSVAQQIAGQPIGTAQSIQSNIIPYMNYGQGAQTIPYQNQYDQAQAVGGAAYSGINRAVQGLGNAFQNSNAFQNWANPASGSFSGGDFSGAFSSSPYYSGGGNSYGFTM